MQFSSKGLCRILIARSTRAAAVALRQEEVRSQASISARMPLLRCDVDSPVGWSFFGVMASDTENLLRGDPFNFNTVTCSLSSSASVFTMIWVPGRNQKLGNAPEYHRKTSIFRRSTNINASVRSG